MPEGGIIEGSCPVTSIGYLALHPGGPPEDHPARGIFLLNGIGLDAQGFRPALENLTTPYVLDRHPYAHDLHIALTVPGFEDELDRLRGDQLAMEDQARWVEEFISAMVESNGLSSLVLYGFSYGADLLVGTLECLREAGHRVERVVFTEINVDVHSCFITQRIHASYEAAAPLGGNRHRQAYTGFVSRILKAFTEGHLSARLMQDMTRYFGTIARKDWHQLAHSAAEVSQDPESRIRQVFALSERLPGTRMDFCFSDLRDLRVFQQHRKAWPRPLPDIHVFDQTLHEHFHAMGPGVAELLRGAGREV